MKNYQNIKTDHDSDCAVYNEPYMPNGSCNCGLIKPCIDGINDYLKISGPFVHEGEKDGLASAFQSGYNFKIIGEDTQYLLDEFKRTEPEYFDKLGNCYPSQGIDLYSSEMELMRHLIYKLEEIINQKDNTDWAF